VRLWAALGELSERQRAVLVLRYYEASAPMYQLLFSYPEGPLVSVEIAVGCYPEVGGGDFQSNRASSVVPVIQQLLKGT